MSRKTVSAEQSRTRLNLIKTRSSNPNRIEIAWHDSKTSHVGQGIWLCATAHRSSINDVQSEVARESLIFDELID